MNYFYYDTQKFTFQIKYFKAIVLGDSKLQFKSVCPYQALIWSKSKRSPAKPFFMKSILTLVLTGVPFPLKWVFPCTYLYLINWRTEDIFNLNLANYFCHYFHILLSVSSIIKILRKGVTKQEEKNKCLFGSQI